MTDDVDLDQELELLAVELEVTRAQVLDLLRRLRERAASDNASRAARLQKNGARVAAGAHSPIPPTA